MKRTVAALRVAVSDGVKFDVQYGGCAIWDLLRGEDSKNSLLFDHATFALELPAVNQTFRRSSALHYRKMKLFISCACTVCNGYDIFRSAVVGRWPLHEAASLGCMEANVSVLRVSGIRRSPVGGASSLLSASALPTYVRTWCHVVARSPCLQV